MRYFSEWLIRVSSGWLAVGALVIFLLFTALVLPAQAAQVDTGNEQVGSPDLSFYYSPGELYRMAEAYGEVGREGYIRARFTFDLLWPLVYTFFLTTVISWLFAHAFQSGSLWRLANLAPVMAMCLDYLENISTSWVMYRYPQPANLMASLAPLFTMAKWVFVGASFVLLLMGLVGVVWRWMKG